MAELLDDRTESDGGEEGESTNDHDDSDSEADEHSVVGAEGPERVGHDVLRCQPSPEGQGGDHDGVPSEQHVDGADDVVEGGIAGETSERRAVVVTLRGEPIQ